MSWRKFEGCSLQELANGMGVPVENLTKVPIKSIERMYHNFIVLRNAEEQFKKDKTLLCLEEKRGE